MRERAKSKADQLFPSLEERIRHLHWLAFLRVVITTFIAGSLFLIVLPAPITLFYTLIATNILANLLAAFFVGRGKSLSAWTYFSIYWDIVFVSLLVYLSGGLESPFVFLYFLSLIYAGIVLSSKEALITAMFCFLSYGLILTSQAAGILPSFSYEHESAFYPEASPKEVLFAILTNGIGFFITAILSSLVAEQVRKTTFRLREKERELEQYKARFDDIVRTVQIGLITTNRAGQITYINPTGERFLRKKLDELKGKRIQDVIPDLAADKPVEFEYTLPEGEKKYLGAVAQTMANADGEKEGMVISIRDLTDVKKMQQEIMRTEKLAALGRMAANIAHEIRNPLTSISGCVELLQQEMDADQTNERLLKIIMKEIKRLNDLISDFLYLAKPPRRVESTVDISNMLHDLAYAASINPQCRDRIEIETELDSNIMVNGDPSQLRQMFWNILVNSIQAIENEGKITIRAKTVNGEGGRMAEISIEDTGVGIPAEIMDNIFDPFFTTKEKGTGLGLTIAYKIAESHEGKISVDSEAGKGTTFTVRLPLSEDVSGE